MACVADKTFCTLSWTLNIRNFILRNINGVIPLCFWRLNLSRAWPIDSQKLPRVFWRHPGLAYFVCELEVPRNFRSLSAFLHSHPSLNGQMLVVFKSAPILKRALKVKQAMLQLYVLKLLKIQTKYLGRQWRKSNMKTMSAIYQKVRHRMNDDWAYGNGEYSESSWPPGDARGLNKTK